MSLAVSTAVTITSNLLCATRLVIVGQQCRSLFWRPTTSRRVLSPMLYPSNFGNLFSGFAIVVDAVSCGRPY